MKVFHSVLAIVALIALLCTAAPPASDLSHDSAPFSGVSHSDSYNDASDKEDQHFTTALELKLKREDAAFRAGCKCYDYNFLVTSHGYCECVRDLSSLASKRDLIAGNEEEKRAPHECPRYCTFHNGFCNCSDKRDIVERDTVDGTEEKRASQSCPKYCTYHFGFCNCSDKRNIVERDTVAETIKEKRKLTAYIQCPERCPPHTHAFFYIVAGESRCTCRPIRSEFRSDKRDIVERDTIDGMEEKRASQTCPKYCTYHFGFCNCSDKRDIIEPTAATLTKKAIPTLPPYKTCINLDDCPSGTHPTWDITPDGLYYRCLCRPFPPDRAEKRAALGPEALVPVGRPFPPDRAEKRAALGPEALVPVASCPESCPAGTYADYSQANSFRKCICRPNH